MKHLVGQEHGSLLIETLVGMLLLGIMGMAIGKATISLITTREHSVRTSVATQIAVNELEILKSRNPSTLSSADEISEASPPERKFVTRHNVEYLRLVEVTEHPDGSRTIAVRVQGPNPRLGGKANLTAIVVPWGPS